MPRLLSEVNGEEWQKSLSSPPKGGADEEGAGEEKNDGNGNVLSSISPNIKSTPQKPSSSSVNNAAASAIAIEGGGENLWSNSKDGSTKSIPRCADSSNTPLKNESESKTMAVDDVGQGEGGNVIPREGAVAVDNLLQGEGFNILHEAERVVEQMERIVPPKVGINYFITIKNGHFTLTIVTDAWGEKESVEKNDLCTTLANPFYRFGFKTVQINVKTHRDFGRTQAIVEKHDYANMICELLHENAKAGGVGFVGKCIANSKITMEEYEVKKKEKEMQRKEKSAGQQTKITAAFAQKPSLPVESVETKIAAKSVTSEAMMMEQKKKSADLTSTMSSASSFAAAGLMMMEPKKKSAMKMGVNENDVASVQKSLPPTEPSKTNIELCPVIGPDGTPPPAIKSPAPHVVTAKKPSPSAASIQKKKPGTSALNPHNTSRKSSDASTKKKKASKQGGDRRKKKKTGGCNCPGGCKNGNCPCASTKNGRQQCTSACTCVGCHNKQMKDGAMEAFFKPKPK